MQVIGVCKICDIARRAVQALLIFAWAWSGLAGAQAQERDGGAVLVRLEGAIGPAAKDYVSKALERAREVAAQLVILQIDTPGGLDSSTREIVRDIIASPVPVACYVAPSGARAASAGTYILYACHIAAMAPGTNVGAATPIQIGGVPLMPSEDKKKDDEAKDKPKNAAEMKAVNDSIAYLRSLAEMRGRNVEWAEAAVRDAASISSAEALKIGVIDIMATNTTDLLKQLDGRSVEASFGTTTLATTGMALMPYDPDWRTRLLAVITNPNVAYILLLIGVYGLLLEFYNPGTFVAGITGAICLFLGLYALNLLPINYAGFALLGLGIVLMVSEAFVPSFGALGLGGTIAFVVGSVMLMDTDAPGFTVNRMLVGSIATVTSGLFLFVMMLLLKARRRAVTTGLEEMVSSRGEVVDWSGSGGHVRVHGEIWKARSDTPLEAGRPVVIRGIHGLTVDVAPEEKETTQ
jgi:membrane-bound serine protease (ClpP class)